MMALCSRRWLPPPRSNVARHTPPSRRSGRPRPTLAWRATLAHRLPKLNPDTAPAVLVLDAHEQQGRCRIKVRLPSRPNTASTWIDAERVRLRTTPWRIVVDRSERTVSLLRKGKVVARRNAVIGTAGTPTPTGLFAIASVWRNPSTDFLGSWVLPITAHSDVLKTFDGGDGRVALHGRGGASLNDPVGSAASHGCVRLRNADITGLVRRVGVTQLPGTPVRITD